MKVILFGSGNYGKKALQLIGKENVVFFIDNNEERTGCLVDGIKVVSFNMLKKINVKNYYIVISVSDRIKFDLAEQLIEYSICDFIFCDYLEEFVESKFSNYSMLCKKSLFNLINRYQDVKKIYEEKIASLEEQLDNEKLLPEDRNSLPRKCESFGDNKEVTTVEFYLIDSFEIFHFEILYHLLREHNIYARFVAEPISINTAGEWFDYKKAKAILRERNLEYTEHCNIDADIAFTTQFSHTLRKYRRAIKINMTYGCSLNKNGFWFQERAMKGFDYKFVGGQFIKDKCLEKKILDKGHIKVIGSPKHYDFADKQWDKNTMYRSLGITTDKPILVYFPTWDEDSSILMYKEQFMQLQDRFYIITKPHHCTYRLQEKRDELAALYEISDIVLDGNYDFENAAMLGDIRICDAKSGSALECCYLNNNIPTIFLSVRPNIEEYFYSEIFDIAGAVVNERQKLLSCVFNIQNNRDIREIKDINYYFDVHMNRQKLWKGFIEIFKDNDIKY